MQDHSRPASRDVAEASSYPAVYRLTTTTRWLHAVGAAGCLSGGAFLALVIGAQHRPDRFAALAMGAVLAASALWFLLRALRTRLVLWPDQLDHRDAIVTRRIAAADIRGRRTPRNRRGVLLEMREGRGRRVRVAADLRRDALSDAWFDRLPDLDEAERDASLTRLRTDPTIGASAVDVDERLASVIWGARVVNAVAIVLVVWARFAPFELRLNAALSLALPLLSLWACLQWRGLLRLVPDIGAGDVRPTLFPALLLPSLALVQDLPFLANFPSWHGVIAPALAVGALAAALALKLEHARDALPRRGAMAAWVLFAASAYAGTAGLVADVWLDRAAVTPVRASVIGVDGRPDVAVAGHIAWLGPANTGVDWTSMRVDAPDFAFLRVGDVACIGEHAGLLGIAWAELRRCADTPDRAPDAAARHWLAHVIRPAAQRAAVVQRLVDGDWRAVDAELVALQQRYERGEAAEAELEQAYAPLSDVDPALDAPLQDWLAGAPRSYAAHLAMALHAEIQSERLSRGGFNEHRSPTLNANGRAAFAREQLAASIPLSTRPVLSLLAQYRLAPNGARDGQDWVAKVVAVDPEDIAMRREYLVQHPPHPGNGGKPDDPAMRWLLQSGPSERVSAALAARRLFEHAVEAGGTPRSMAMYRQVLVVAPYPQDAYMSHINLGAALADRHELDAAVVELKAAIATLPGNVHAHEMLGWIYEQQGRKPEALAEFLIDAARGQSWAQMRAGSFMLQPEPGVPLDRETGAFWMRRAADGGEAQARDILRRHPDLMAQYPPTY